MSRKTIGMLLGAAAAGLLWHFRKKIAGLAGNEYNRYILLKARADGGCGIVEHPEEVELKRSRGDVVHWIVTNPALESCGRTVEVCIAGWRNAAGPTEPPVDILWRCKDVKQGHKKTITGHVKSRAEPGDYYYDVLIDGEIALDPIVRIVL